MPSASSLHRKQSHGPDMERRGVSTFQSPGDKCQAEPASLSILVVLPSVMRVTSSDFGNFVMCCGFLSHEMEFTAPLLSRSFVTFSLLEVPAAPTTPRPLCQKDEGLQPDGCQEVGRALGAGQGARRLPGGQAECSFWWAD